MFLLPLYLNAQDCINCPLTSVEPAWLSVEIWNELSVFKQGMIVVPDRTSHFLKSWGHLSSLDLWCHRSLLIITKGVWLDLCSNRPATLTRITSTANAEDARCISSRSVTQCVGWSQKSWLQLFHTYGKIWVWHRPYKDMRTMLIVFIVVFIWHRLGLLIYLNTSTSDHFMYCFMTSCTHS